MNRFVRCLNSDRTRRGVVVGLAALFAGCSTGNSAQQPQSDPEPQQNDSEQPPAAEEPSQPSQGEGTQQDSEGEQAEDDEEEQAAASDWNWNDVLQAEQQFKQDHQIDRVAEAAINGEKIGENLEDIDNNAYAYSHGGQTWDLQHFQNLDLTDEQEFKQAINDALTVASHYMNTKEGDFASEWNSEMGITAEKIIEEAHNIDNLQIWGQTNDQHGFNSLLSEQHGVYTADGATPAIGRAGTNPLEGTYGNDIVSQFDESWVDPNSDVPGFKANIAQGFATNGVYDAAGEGINEANVGVHLPLLPEIFNKFKQEDSGEFLWSNYRPAIATSVYKRKAEDFAEDEGIMINPESIEDLPDLRQYENFQNYKQDLEQHTETLVGEEAMGKVYLGEKE